MQMAIGNNKLTLTNRMNKSFYDDQSYVTLWQNELGTSLFGDSN